ncbi:MAG: cation transporter [Anaerolineales bacterium]
MTDREWRPPRWMNPFFKLAPWGFPRQIILLLADSDKSFSEILEGFAHFMHHMGHYGREDIVAGFTSEAFSKTVWDSLGKLESEDQISLQDEIYSLTPKGQQLADLYRQQYRELGAFVKILLHPQTVSLVGLGVHIVLAILKLIAGSLSGSIGLISDGMDTAMDGLSSILVYIGLRLKKEQYINIVLVLLMIGVGAGAGYEAIQRIFLPKTLGIDLLTFAAAVISGLVCLLLGFYQQYVATRSRQLPLISQAVDSRNHTIVAAGVTVGLLAALLRFPLLDALVGLAIAILILKSGIELAVETVRALRGEEVDFSRYELAFVEDYKRFQEKQLADWLLSVVAEEGLISRSTLVARSREMLDVEDVPVLREMGWGKTRVGVERQVTNALEALFEQGLLTLDEDSLKITPEGFNELGQTG